MSEEAAGQSNTDIEVLLIVLVSRDTQTDIIMFFHHFSLFILLYRHGLGISPAPHNYYRDRKRIIIRRTKNKVQTYIICTKTAYHMKHIIVYKYMIDFFHIIFSIISVLCVWVVQSHGDNAPAYYLYVDLQIIRVRVNWIRCRCR